MIVTVVEEALYGVRVKVEGVQADYGQKRLELGIGKTCITGILFIVAYST